MLYQVTFYRRRFTFCPLLYTWSIWYSLWY